MAADAIEEIDITLLGRLRDRVDALAVAGYGEQRRRRGKIAIPDVVVHALEGPDAFSRGGVKREQRIGKQILTDAIGAIKVRDRRTGGHVEDAAFLIKRHAGPVIGRAGVQPCVLRPRVVAVFARIRDGVEAPAQSAGVHVEGADVAGRRRMRLRIAPADDDQVFIDNAGRGQRDGLFAVVAAQIFPEIDAAVFSKALDRTATCGIERIEKICDTGEEPAFRSIAPPSEAANRLGAAHSRIELPAHRSCRRIERDDLLRGCVGIECASDDQRARLQANAFFVRIVGPRNAQPADIGAVDLCQRRVVIVRLLAAVDRPIACLGRGLRAMRICGMQYAGAQKSARRKHPQGAMCWFSSESDHSRVSPHTS